MEKLIYYFVLISSLFCGVGGASSYKPYIFTKEELEILANEDPYQRISDLFTKGLKDNDYRNEIMIVSVPRIIAKVYPNHKDLQAKAVNAYGKCMRNQMVNGQRKYTDMDIAILVSFSKKKLGLN